MTSYYASLFNPPLAKPSWAIHFLRPMITFMAQPASKHTKDKERTAAFEIRTGPIYRRPLHCQVSMTQ